MSPDYFQIDVTKIDKRFLKRVALKGGREAVYLSLRLVENRDGKDLYGNDGFVSQSIPKEARDAGDKAPILGNWKHSERRQEQPAKPAQTRREAAPDPDELPDDIPW